MEIIKGELEKVRISALLLINLVLLKRPCALVNRFVVSSQVEEQPWVAFFRPLFS